MEMSEAHCNLQTPDGNLTVGQEFSVTCDGALPHLDIAKTEIRLDEADRYKLHLLSMQQTDNQLQLVVTSYEVGDHQLKAVQLVDPTNSLVLGDLSFSVKSVLDPKEPPSEPYGPRGPLGLSLPWWYYALWVVVIAVVVGYVVRRLRQYWQKKKLIEEMVNQGSALTPYHQFTKTIRQLQRQHLFLAEPAGTVPEEEKKAVLSELENSYRLFLGRSFLLPTLQWNDGQILSDLRRSHRSLFRVQGEKIRQLLREYERARSAVQSLQAKDFAQLMQLSRHNVDDLYGYLQRREKT
jgi:hypothetical protein